MPLTQVSPALLDTQAQYTGFKNRIINGDMRIDQRNAGASFTSSGLFYCIDRWMLQAIGANNSAQQVTGSTGNNTAVRITGASGNTLTGFSQRIEAVNIYDCASQTITVSFTVSGSASGSVSVRFLYPTATNNYTSTTEPVAGTTVNFTTTPTQYSVTRTLDSNANKGVWVYLDFGAVGAGVTRTLEFFQLEKGSTATSFDYRPFGTELALCQRYYQKLTAMILSGYATSGVSIYGVITFSVELRTSPTMVYSSFVNSNSGNASTNFVNTKLLRTTSIITSTGSGFSTFDVETSGAEL
jgi:hypothetical protein